MMVAADDEIGPDAVAEVPGRDATLYGGSARFYAVGRISYPPELVEAVMAEVPELADGVVLDVGCGPGSLGLLLAPAVRAIIGIDADVDMVREAARLAHRHGIRNARWRAMYAEDLPGDLPPVDVVTIAQSFHWMDRPAVAAAAHALLWPGGVLVHVHGTTDRGTDELASVDAELRSILDSVSPTGEFAERTAPIQLEFWRRG